MGGDGEVEFLLCNAFDVVVQVNKVCGGLKVDFAVVGVHCSVLLEGGTEKVMGALFVYIFVLYPPNPPALRKRLFAALGFVSRRCLQMGETRLATEAQPCGEVEGIELDSRMG